MTAGVLWSLVSVLLNFGLTILSPTTRCRRCNYQLLAHLDSEPGEQIVQCPECGSDNVAYENTVCSECESTNPFRISGECRACNHWWEQDDPSATETS